MLFFILESHRDVEILEGMQYFCFYSMMQNPISISVDMTFDA